MLEAQWKAGEIEKLNNHSGVSADVSNWKDSCELNRNRGAKHKSNYILNNGFFYFARQAHSPPPPARRSGAAHLYNELSEADALRNESPPLLWPQTGTRDQKFSIPIGGAFIYVVDSRTERTDFQRKIDAIGLI